MTARLGGIVWGTADGLVVMVAADLRHIWERLAAAHGLTDGCGPVRPTVTSSAAWPCAERPTSTPLLSAELRLRLHRQ